MGIGSEMGKAVGQTLIDSVADARGFVGKLFGPAVTELGETMGDQARFLRFRNLARIMERVQAIADARNLAPENFKALPFGDALRAADAASDEDDDSVQDLWARLIANAADPDGSGTIAKVHIDVLKSLSAPEASFLNLLWAFPEGERPLTMAAYDKWAKRLSDAAEETWRQFPEDARDVAIQNLQRLRCVTFKPARLSTHGLLSPVPRSLSPSGNWAVIDYRKFERLIDEIKDMIGAAAGVHEYRQGNSSHRAKVTAAPERHYQLTPLGDGLMKACSLKR